MSSTNLYKLINIWYYITIVFLAFLVIKFAFPILLPFIFAIIVAAVLKSPINFLERKLKLKRSFVSFVTVTIVLLTVLSSMGLLFYSVYDWLSETLEYLPKLLPALTSFTENATNFFTILGESLPESFESTLKNLPSKIIEGVTDWITSTLSRFAKGIPDGFITVFITILSSYLVTRDYNKLSAFFKSTVSATVYNNIIKTKRLFFTKTVGIIKGYSIITILTFLQLYIGFGLLNIHHASAIAAVTAIVDLLPILGVGAILIPWAVILFITGEILQGVGLLILYSVVTVIHNIIAPKIVANQIKLDALTVLASMYIGYSLIGFVGLIFAPLITSVARDLIMNEKTEPTKAQL